jgi:endonuclease/exonuclease/phosphatase family metal-dependent hydrolase
VLLVPDVRVATYNLYLGADLSRLFEVADADGLAAAVAVVRSQLDGTRFEERAAAVAALLARERPDLVGLQEVSRWTSGPTGFERVDVDVLPTLLAAAEAAGAGYDAHVVNENFTGAMPVSESDWVGLVGANVTLVRRDGPVEVVGEATGRYATGHDVVTGLEGVTFPIVRSWGRVDVRVDGVPLRFVNTHTEAYDGPARDAQRDECLAANADVEGPVVVVGDFNTTPDLVGVPEPWVDAWTAGEGDGFTFGQDGDLANDESGMRERIDYVFVRDAEVRRTETFGDRQEDRSTPHRLWPSDHAGVVADLRLP